MRNAILNNSKGIKEFETIPLDKSGAPVSRSL